MSSKSLVTQILTLEKYSYGIIEYDNRRLCVLMLTRRLSSCTHDVVSDDSCDRLNFFFFLVALRVH